MRIYQPLIWSLMVSLTSQNVLPRSSDPVADLCSPLCSDQDTLALEEDCGRLLGCSDLDIQEDPEVVLGCWTPCFAPTEECFSLCVERFDLILQMCYNDCSQQEDPIDCIAVCFNVSFMDFRRGLTNNEDNSTGDTNSNFSEQPEVTRSQTTAVRNTTDPAGVQIEESEVIEIVMPRAYTNLESKFEAEGSVHDTRLHLENIRLDTSVDNNDTSVDMLDSNETMTVDTFLSKLIPDIFYTEWRLLKKNDRSHIHNRDFRSRKSSQHKETTDYYFTGDSSSAAPSLQTSNNGTN